MKKSFLGVVLAALATPAMAASDAAARFGARANIEQVSISPDGKMLAYIQAAEARGAALIVLPVAGGDPIAVVRSTGEPDRLRECRWSTNTRLVCNIYMILDGGNGTTGFTRMIAVDADGKNLKLLSAHDSSNALQIVYGGGDVIDWAGGVAGGAVLMTRRFVPENQTGTHLANTSEGMGVERVDTVSLKRSILEPANSQAREYISDGNGTVRIMGLQPSDATGYDRNVVNYSYRKTGERSWQPLGQLRLGAGMQTGFDPYAVDPAKNVAYGFDQHGGHTALFSLTLDGSLTRTLLLSRPDVDIDTLIQIGRQQRVVGASYATEKRQVEFFDPELKRLAASLSKALPGLPLVTFVDASADESKLVLFAGSDVDPGHYYVFDKTTRHLDELSPARPQLADVKLAAVKPVIYKAADGTPIPGYLTLPPAGDAKNLPTIVMPHGGPGARDEWGFDWLAQFFANRGFAVLQPNFRGSTGYGEAWFKDNGFKSWRAAIGDVNDGGRWLIAQGIADPGKLAIVGWSYGGYAALQSAVLDPTLFKAIIAVAPVTDLETLRGESVGYTNHALVDAFIGNGPHVREGSPAQNADRIAAPVLMFHGDRDQNVRIGESRLMLSRLKNANKQVELVEFHHLDHQLEDSAVRATMLDKMDGFLRASLKLPPAP